MALLKLVGGGNLHGHGLSGNDVHERATLLAGEDRGVNSLGVFLLGEDHAGAGPTQGFMHGGRHDIGVRYGVGVQAGSDKAGEVGHVYPQFRPHLVGDGAEGRKILVARVGGPAGDNHLRPFGQGLLPHSVHVDTEGGGVYFVGDHLVEFPGKVQAHAMGKVAAVGEGQSHDFIARVGERHEHGSIGLGAGVRLHIGEFGAEEGFCAVAGQVFYYVGVFAATIIAAARVALGVFIGEHGALGLENAAGHEIFRGNHFQGGALAT